MTRVRVGLRARRDTARKQPQLTARAIARAGAHVLRRRVAYSVERICEYEYTVHGMPIQSATATNDTTLHDRGPLRLALETSKRVHPTQGVYLPRPLASNKLVAETQTPREVGPEVPQRGLGEPAEPGTRQATEATEVLRLPGKRRPRREAKAPGRLDAMGYACVSMDRSVSGAKSVACACTCASLYACMPVHMHA